VPRRWAFLLVAPEARPQAAPPYEQKFGDAGGIRLHYLDFGGDGLPIVFVHSEAWDAHTCAEFAPLRGSESRPGHHPAGLRRVGGAPGRLRRPDAGALARRSPGRLGVERAVFAGNASATAELTFLGEHHPDRVAGLIYFTGLAVPWLEEHDACSPSSSH
jgi:pimeloyl-ACP methyl ester carboxylesterase